MKLFMVTNLSASMTMKSVDHESNIVNVGEGIM